ncbi:MAG: HAMP domain-containing histidine kinase [Oscillospiraceae bacterium]|nr:HAMP domain-containing histidine kinase [Oscillospiraceae bacterium]
MIRKLRVKFICIIMTVVTVMLGVIFGLVLHITSQNLQRECLQALQQAADSPGFLLDRRENAIGLPYFVITQDLWGNLRISGNVNLEIYGEEELQSFWQAAQQGTEQIGEIEDYDLRFMRSNSPSGLEYVFVDVTSQKNTMSNLRKSCLGIGTVCFAAFWGISILLARWAVRPVENAWDQQRQFVADASHELKTPLTVILTNAELLQEPEYGEGERGQFAGSIQAMACQMRGLVESLLQLARADSGQSKQEVAPLDYSKLVADALLPFEPLYFEQGLLLESDVEPGLRLTGTARSLSQVVDILLDNGLKYAAPGGTVRLTLRSQGRGQCVLSVSSPGQTLTPQQCRDIFRRFYRVDQARSMNHSYGLGLAIAQRIVADHRGRIWAEGRDGVNTFYVILPMI